MSMPATNLPVLRKPSATIQISNVFSGPERKLLNTLMWHAQTEEGGLADEELRIGLPSVFEAIGWGKSHNTDGLKELLVTLTTTAITWNEFGVDKKERWAVCTFLAGGAIDSKELAYEINPVLRRKIRRPTLYAKVQLVAQSKFAKRHSLPLYEHFSDLLDRGGVTELELVRVELDFLYRLLRLGETRYAEAGGFAIFNRDVLKPCIKEINEYSDLSIDATVVREKRKAVAVAFKIARKQSYQMEFELPGGGVSPTADLEVMLESLSVSHAVAAKLASKYTREQITSAVAYTKLQLDKGKVKNPAGFVRRYLEEDWSASAATSTATVEQSSSSPSRSRNSQAKAKAALKAEQAERSEAFKHFQGDRLKQRFAEKSKHWQTRRQKVFVEQLEAGRGGATLAKAYKKRGFDSSPVMAAFLTSLKPDLLTAPEEKDAKIWAAQQRSTETLEERWHYVLTALTAEASDSVESWFSDVRPRDFADQTLVLTAPTSFVTSRIRDHYRDRIQRLWQQCVCAPEESIREIQVEVAEGQKRAAAG